MTEIVNKIKDVKDKFNDLHNELVEASNKKDLVILAIYNKDELVKQMDKLLKIVEQVEKEKNKILDTRRKNIEIEADLKRKAEEKKQKRKEQKIKKVEVEVEKPKIEEEINLEDYKELLDRIKDKRHYIYGLNEEGEYKLLGSSRSIISLTEKINKIQDYYIFVSLKYNSEDEIIKYNMSIKRLRYDKPAPNSFLLSPNNTINLVNSSGSISKYDPELKDNKTDKLLINELLPNIINKLDDLEQNKIKDIKSRKIVKSESKVLSKELFGKALKDLTPEEKKKYEAEKKKRQRQKKKAEAEKKVEEKVEKKVEEKKVEKKKPEKKVEEKKKPEKKNKVNHSSKMNIMIEKIINSYKKFIEGYIDDDKKVEKYQENLMDNLNKYLNTYDDEFEAIKVDDNFMRELNKTTDAIDDTDLKKSDKELEEYLEKSLENIKKILKK
jgi:hypothetical protein